MRRSALLLLGLSSLFEQIYAIGQDTRVTFKSSSNSFSVVSNGKAASVLISPDEWPGVQVAAMDFVTDIQRVTNVKPSLTNVSTSATSTKATNPIIIGTLGKSSLIDRIVNNTKLDVSSINGKWESFISQEVKNPLPGVDSAYVIIGSDKRGTIFALYDHSEQFGVSPWYWWADVPTTQHSEIFVAPTGCKHSSPTVKYRGIFLNDEQPALQAWAMVKFTNGTGSVPLNSPFNHLFYTKLFELILRLKANYLWPAMWGSAFAIDDPQNQFLADFYGVVMGTSHQEPMMRSTPNEFSIFEKGAWDYVGNKAVVQAYWLEGTQRARPFESLYTLGMRGFGDKPLSETTDIDLLEQVIADQTEILTDVYGDSIDVSQIPQLWALYTEVEGYYDDGMRVPEYVTLLWSDDNFGNIRRFPTVNERNRTGGAGVYYHVDFVGPPTDSKWAPTTQIEKIHEQMSIAVDRVATTVWILNVGDLKPYEREIDFFLTYAWDASKWNSKNLNTFVGSWAQREFDVSPATATKIEEIVGNLTRFTARRKPEFINSTTFSLTNYREADNVVAAWKTLESASTAIYNSLPAGTKPAFFQLVQHPVLANSNLGQMMVAAGKANLRASQAMSSANMFADQAVTLFEHDFDLETQYHQLLDGKWVHMMDQTHLGYYYWQQPMTNTMPMITRVQSKKQNIAGPMRIAPERTLAAWPGDNMNQCAQMFSCPFPTVTLDNFNPISDFYVDVGVGGPTGFDFAVTSNVTWLKLSLTKGSAVPNKPDVRVFISVPDWSKLQAGQNVAKVTFKATTPNQPPLSTAAVPITFIAQKNVLPSNFKGFVEGAGALSIEAAHATRNNTVNGIAWAELPGYGKTLSAVTPQPHTDANFTAGSGPSLEYDFFNFNTLGGKGNVTVSIVVSPSFNANGDDRPLAFALQIDSLAMQTKFPMPVPLPGALPAGWDTPDGFVANAKVTVNATFNGVSPGAHTLKLFMIEPAVVIQKIMINTGGLLPSYLGPPESIVMH